MAKSVQKITLNGSRDIAFNKLVLSQSNVRHVKAGLSIEQLAEDIARRGLLQSLNVRPMLDGEGNETGMFEVPAGGRRYRAIALLVQQKRLAKTAPVPCVVSDPGSSILAEDDSLTENIQRVPLHPLDQFRAFQALRDKGRSEEDIAAAHFVSVNVVKQRMRLAAVSPKLLDLYAEDGMPLEQLMAFTVSDDHTRQEQVWDALQRGHSQDSYQIRCMLTERAVRASDKRVRFVGLSTYEAAGGVVMRDLFEQDDGGWLQDVGLLDGLVAEKLKAEAEGITSEGWRWIEVAVDFPYEHTRGLRRITGEPAPLSAADQAQYDALIAERAGLEETHADADELPDHVGRRLDEIDAALERLKDAPTVYDPEDVSRAGVFISIGPDGSLRTDYGYVRPQDEPQTVAGSDESAEPASGASSAPASSGEQRTTISVVDQAEPQGDDDDVIRPLPDRLLMELTAHRTLALRNAVANNPHVALTALLHRLCLDMFQHSLSTSCLEASVAHVFFAVQASDLRDCPSAKAVGERHDRWKAELPTDEAALWNWLTGLDDSRRAALLAHCVSFGINALYEKGDRYGAGPTVHGVRHRLAQADRLATHGRQLSGPRDQAPHPRSRARSAG